MRLYRVVAAGDFDETTLASCPAEALCWARTQIPAHLWMTAMVVPL